MANLVTPPAESPLTDAQLASAEALIAARLGLPSLQEETGVGQMGEIGSSGLIPLERPAVSIQTLYVAGAAGIGLLRTPWTVDVSGMVRPYLTGGFLGTTYARLPYIITYTTGWTAETLPEGIRQAVLLTAASGAAAAGRVGVTAERMGPVSYSYADAATVGSLGADALAFLQPYLPLRY
ncbi:hypothetical protein [Deinococcus navajonensis]|uniref:Phage gp6-like head-tail connector protein n=1 Tax=Deinococcus navajonensis TaxID=309884 RepID=A0ABV8XQT8_9DEIO